MTDRPAVSPGVLGGVAEGLPARLRRRLDADPLIAEAWRWSGSAELVEVVASADAQVTIACGPRGVSSLDQLRCTCLLAPRCLHVAAVLLRLPLSDEPPDVAAEPEDRSDKPLVALGEAQRAAAEQAWLAAAALLDAGAAGAGLLLIGELLRAVHSCREASLHRVAAAGLRVAQRLRDLHAERPEFRLGALASDLADMLSTARQLTQASEVQTEWLGTARRAYASIGSLRVTGLLSEAVVSAAGYAGVVTYVCDQSGRLWSLGDVAPGPPERCLLAYGSPVDLGDASLDHSALSREGLHLQRATASAEGRLGAGRGVTAVRASGGDWTVEPLASLWREPLDVQLDRAWAARGSAFSQRAGADLVFVRGVVQGVRENALELVLEGDLRVSGLAASDHPELPYRSNLRLLGSAPGLPLLVVGRVMFARPRSVVLLAVAPGPPAAGEVALDLPAGLGDRVNLGLDVLQHAYVRGASATPIMLPGGVGQGFGVDPLDPLRRRVYQVVSGGRSAVSEPAWSGLARDESALDRAQLMTAGQVLRVLRTAVANVGSASAEARRERLARAWLVAWTYLGAATARLQRLSWTDARSR
jgi:hypothetical protein